MTSGNNFGNPYKFSSGLYILYFGPRATNGRMEYLEGWYFKEYEEFAFTISSNDGLLFASMDSFNQFQNVQRNLSSWLSKNEFEKLLLGLKEILTTKDPKKFSILPVI